MSEFPHAKQLVAGDANLGDFYHIDVTAFPLITEYPSCTSAVKYSHLLLTVSNMGASLEFYAKLGFIPIRFSSNVHILSNSVGFELHLAPCRRPVDEAKNLLMDFPSEKYPGHTHFACPVPSVPAIRTYLDSVGISLRYVCNCFSACCCLKSKMLVVLVYSAANDPLEIVLHQFLFEILIGQL